MAGQIVSFPSNGGSAEGYLALPASGKGPGVIVIQEWWGLVPHIKDVADRFAAEGYVALAPDLYHGKTTKEPDEAGKMMMALNMEQAAKDMSGAYDYVKNHPACTGKVGSVGFCMGGGLSLTIASLRPIDACVDYYGDGRGAEARRPEGAGAGALRRERRLGEPGGGAQARGRLARHGEAGRVPHVPGHRSRVLQ